MLEHADLTMPDADPPSVFGEEWGVAALHGIADRMAAMLLVDREALIRKAPAVCGRPDLPDYLTARTKQRTNDGRARIFFLGHAWHRTLRGWDECEGSIRKVSTGCIVGHLRIDAGPWHSPSDDHQWQ